MRTIFPTGGFYEPSPADPEWARLVISAYDHYIEPNEAPPIPYDFRDSARRSEGAAQYAGAEEAFWRLHLQLAKGGVWRVLNGRRVVGLSPNGRRFRDLWVRSHRALLGRSRFVELFYPGLTLRIRHGWDLTDHALVGDEASSVEVRRMVAEAGLFVLPTRQPAVP